MVSYNTIVKNFAPGWFASVMGTGIVAVASHLYAASLPGLQSATLFFWWLSIILFGVLIIPWLLRFIIYTPRAMADLRTPVTGQFYATMPIACLVLSSQFLLIGVQHLDPTLAITLARGFWLVGVLITLLFAIVIPFFNFINHKVEIKHIGPAWFMPPVSLLVIPVPGAKLIAHMPPGWEQALLVFNFLSWSSGLFLFFLLSTISLYRLLCHGLPPGLLAPTLWINLGPIGVGTMSLMGLSTVVAASPWGGTVMQSVLSLLGFLLWGYGFWWLIMLIGLTAHYIAKKDLPFSLSWWALVFPLGAYIAATQQVAAFLNAPFLQNCGFIGYLALLAIWLIVFSRTVIATVQMKLF